MEGHGGVSKRRKQLGLGNVPYPIERHVPGGVAQAVREADNWFSGYLPALNAWRFGAEQAATISQPVLSVLGTQTERWFVDGHDLLHAWFPQVEDYTIDGVGHLLHVQRPEPVARCMAEFFARHPIDGRKDLGERQLLDTEAGGLDGLIGVAGSGSRHCRPKRARREADADPR